MILYIETNLLVGMAFGQDSEATTLLDEAARKASLRLAIPSICFMEASSTFEKRIDERASLARRLYSETLQLARDRTSPIVKNLLDQLDQSLTTDLDYTKRLKLNFKHVVRRVRTTTEIVPLTKATLRRGFAGIIGEGKHKDLILPDNLILHSILGHARRHPAQTKALLSGNSKDFSKPAARDAMNKVGIAKYFTDAKNAVGWYRSQPSS